MYILCGSYPSGLYYVNESMTPILITKDVPTLATFYAIQAIQINITDANNNIQIVIAEDIYVANLRIRIYVNNTDQQGAITQFHTDIRQFRFNEYVYGLTTLPINNNNNNNNNNTHDSISSSYSLYALNSFNRFYHYIVNGTSHDWLQQQTTLTREYMDCYSMTHIMSSSDASKHVIYMFCGQHTPVTYENTVYSLYEYDVTHDAMTIISNIDTSGCENLIATDTLDTPGAALYALCYDHAPKSVQRQLVRITYTPDQQTSTASSSSSSSSSSTATSPSSSSSSSTASASSATSRTSTSQCASASVVTFICLCVGLFVNGSVL